MPRWESRWKRLVTSCSKGLDISGIPAFVKLRMMSSCLGPLFGVLRLTGCNKPKMGLMDAALIWEGYRGDTGRLSTAIGDYFREHCRS